MRGATRRALASLELNTIAALAGDRVPRRIHPGDVIFREGDIGDKLYGSCFGAGALVDPNHRRYGTAVALSEGELLEMNREEFLFAIQELPMFSLEMLHDLEQRLQRLKASDLLP